MKLFNSVLFLLIACFTSIQAQIIFEENFESPELPEGWSVDTRATDGGWRFSNSGVLSSQYYMIPSNGSAGIASTNDDACNCDKSNDRLILPELDLSDVQAAVLQFDVHYFDRSFQGFQEEAFVEVFDGNDWRQISQIEGSNVWRTELVDLSAYAGQESVTVAIRYNDNGGWMFGLSVDNVSVVVPNELDVAFNGLTSLTYGLVGNSISFKGDLYNNGATTINSIQFTLSVDGQEQWTEELPITIGPFSPAEFELNNTYMPNMTGTFLVELAVTMVNGAEDNQADNNTQSIELDIFENVGRENRVQEILDSEPIITEVANALDGLFGPTDLDFFPILGRDELWVINRRTEDEGGSTLTISNASQDEPSDMWLRVDGNAWHFMSLPTALEFSEDNLNFASAPGVQDANHNGGTFTGPSLWSSDPLIYAQPSGGNGSHLDMLHGSPFSLGIAHEVDNVWWIYDNWNKDIVRYDFVEDHGPGNDDHSDALVRRFKGIGISGDNEYPSHMIMDKESGWLYFVDNGNARVMRLDINSGAQTTPLALINEPLTEHSQITGFTVETVIESGLIKPCGIEMIDNYLLVGDFEIGDIIVYDMDNDFAEMGRIFTDKRGLTGIKIGPDGSIWYTNMVDNTLNKVQAGFSTSLEEVDAATVVEVYPNPVVDQIALKFNKDVINDFSNYEILSALGERVLFGNISSTESTIPVSMLTPGYYTLMLTGEEKVSSLSIIKQ